VSNQSWRGMQKVRGVRMQPDEVPEVSGSAAVAANFPISYPKDPENE
jgi:hypothetical protein